MARVRNGTQAILMGRGSGSLSGSSSPFRKGRGESAEESGSVVLGLLGASLLVAQQPNPDVQANATDLRAGVARCIKAFVPGASRCVANYRFDLAPSQGRESRREEERMGVGRTVKAIVVDLHFIVPVIVLLIGICVLVELH